jgi:hypothetical protein
VNCSYKLLRFILSIKIISSLNINKDFTAQININLYNDWTATIGEFTQRKNEIIFKGKKIEVENENPRSQYATIMSDQSFSGGTISAEIMFKELSTKLANLCEIILYYDPATRNFLSVGLGGSWQMYSIRSFTSKWEDHSLTGLYSNLRANKFYKVPHFLLLFQ